MDWTDWVSIWAAIGLLGFGYRVKNHDWLTRHFHNGQRPATVLEALVTSAAFGPLMFLIP